MFDAVVLAGGRGTRLGGADKPGLVVGRQTLLGSVVSAMISAGAARVVVVGPERPAALSPGTASGESGGPGGGARVSYAQEDPPGRGPVAALRRGLAEVSTPAVVLAAADLPSCASARHPAAGEPGWPGRPRRGAAGCLRVPAVAG